MVVEGKRKCRLMDEENSFVELMILSSGEESKMKSLGWLGGNRREEEDEVVLEFSENVRVIVLANEEQGEAPKSRNGKASFQLPKVIAKKKRLPQIQPRTVSSSTEPELSRHVVEKDEWRDDEVFDTESCFARAVKLARAEVVGQGKKFDGDDGRVLKLAATQAAKRSPSLVDEEERKVVSPASKRQSSQQRRGRTPDDEEDGCMQSAVVVDDRTAASMAQKWLEDKTRSIEFAYDVGWKPTKAAKKNINRTCRSAVDDEENVEPLRAFLFKKLRIDGMARGVRAHMTDLIDLILDPSLFSYRLARGVLEDDGDLDFVAIERVLQDIDPSAPQSSKLCSATLLANVKASLAKAQDKSLIEELRNEERPNDEEDDDVVLSTQETSAVVVVDDDDGCEGLPTASNPVQIVDEDDFTLW